MIAYFDSSVVVDMILHPPGDGSPWRYVTHGVISALARVECLRTIDRLRIINRPRPEITAGRYALLWKTLATLEQIEIDDDILTRASRSFPFVIKTLDAIHLTSAMRWREENDEPLLFATHDQQLARAARSVDFDVIGV